MTTEKLGINQIYLFEELYINSFPNLTYYIVQYLEYHYLYHDILLHQYPSLQRFYFLYKKFLIHLKLLA